MLTEQESAHQGGRYSRFGSADWAEARQEAIQRAHRMRSQMAADLLHRFFGALSHAIVFTVQSGAWAFARWNTRRQDRAAIAHLNRLDDCALSDIGIRRSEIESIVRARGRDETRVRNGDERMAA